MITKSKEIQNVSKNKRAENVIIFLLSMAKYIDWELLFPKFVKQKINNSIQRQIILQCVNPVITSLKWFQVTTPKT